MTKFFSYPMSREDRRVKLLLLSKGSIEVSSIICYILFLDKSFVFEKLLITKNFLSLN